MLGELAIPMRTLFFHVATPKKKKEKLSIKGHDERRFFFLGFVLVNTDKKKFNQPHWSTGARKSPNKVFLRHTKKINKVLSNETTKN